METKNFITREMPLWILLIAPFIYMAIVWDKLPNEVPLHWNIYGEVDNYGSPWMLPILLLGIYFGMLLFPMLDPKRENYEKFKKTYYIVRVSLLAFFSIICAITVTAGLGYSISIEKFIVPMLLIVFMIIGNYMSTFRKNWFIGMRTPWTLSNEEVWRKTHIMSGRLWFWVSLIGLPISLFLEKVPMFIFLMIIIIILVAIPMIYSYKKHKELVK